VVIRSIQGMSPGAARTATTSYADRKPSRTYIFAIQGVSTR